MSATVAVIRPRVPLTPAEVDTLSQWTKAGSAHWPEMQASIRVTAGAIRVQSPYPEVLSVLAGIVSERAGEIIGRPLDGTVYHDGD